MAKTLEQSSLVALPEKLDWHTATSDLAWDDGTQILAAVECVCTKYGRRRNFIEYAVVTIRCDEHFFELECNDEAWGWEYDSIGQFALLSGRVQGLSA